MLNKLQMSHFVLQLSKASQPLHVIAYLWACFPDYEIPALQSSIYKRFSEGFSNSSHFDFHFRFLSLAFGFSIFDFWFSIFDFSIFDFRCSMFDVRFLIPDFQQLSISIFIMQYSIFNFFNFQFSIFNFTSSNLYLRYWIIPLIFKI